MRRSILATFPVVAVCLFAYAAPPPTEVRPVREALHGVEFVDEYQWLEGDNSDPKNMGAVTEEVARWTDAQNAYTRSVLDNLPGRKELTDRIRPLMEVGSVSAPRMRGNLYFYTRREGRQAQPIVYVREGFRGEPRALLDPAAAKYVAETGGFVKGEGALDQLNALAGHWPSEDGTLMAFGLYRAGDEMSTVYVLDVRTGAWLKDEVRGKAGSVFWLPDNSGFFYRCLGDPRNPYTGEVRFHRIGTPQSEDSLLFRQFTREENERLYATWGPAATVSRDGRWMILTYYTSTRSNDIWAVDLTKWFATGEFERREIKVGADAMFGGEVVGDTLLMHTNYKAPNYRVVSVDLRNPGESRWRDLIPERKEAVLQNISTARGVLAADYLERACSRIRLFDTAGKALGDLRLPQEIGSAGISTRHDRTEAYLSFTSYNYPSSIFRVDLAKPDAQPELWERPDVPVNPEIAEVKQETYTSRDGTKVTMFIVHKKGLSLDGSNPTILYGYGGFNIPMTPSFSATLFPWFEDGGVYVVANLRGGGEYGKEWHDSGILDRKQNVYDDFIAAAEHLIARKYTNPNRLAISGGSNGGLLTGAMLVQRPDLFRAVICAVPLLDMIRYQHFLMARYWVPEYGDADASRAEFDYLMAYSPYHNIKKGVEYPAVLFTAGENDTRVHALHARKMAAAVQAATAGSPSEKPILLWVDREAGHGQGKPLELRIRDQVDMRIFLMWQLGMLDGK